jgi:hypothetical protein
MPSPIRIPLGAPGIYKLPDSPLRALTGVRMDVCAFVGVAPRGPARSHVPAVNDRWIDDRPCGEGDRPACRTVAVAVENFDEYRRLFGGFEGPGLLPYSVAAFFEQGGRRAYISRIVHDYRDPLDATKSDPVKNAAGVAVGIVFGAGTGVMPLKLRARNEGSWGNQLRAALDFATRPIEFETSEPSSLTVDEGTQLPSGSLLRLTLKDATRVLRLVTNIKPQPRAQRAGFANQAIFNQLLPADLKSTEVVEGVLRIDDGDGRIERHERFGFSALHPRWLATVLSYESDLVFPDKIWTAGEVIPVDVDLLPLPWSDSFAGGEDRYAAITPDDFFDYGWTFGDDEPGNGVHTLVQLSDLSLLVVPDLYSPAPLAPVENVIDPVSLVGPEFEPCIDLPFKPSTQTQAVNDLQGLRLDPRFPADREAIIHYQKQLLDLAERLRSFIVLLDVPPGLSHRQILSWRAHFDSAYAAAYHSWLQVSRGNDSRRLVRVPPSAVAAGVIAKQELAFGVPQGPANVLAAQVVGIDDVVSAERHDELHPQGINVYLRERDGIRLTAARTLSRDPQWRQLSVRRLLTMIKRALEQQMQWVVFEPNNAALRADVRFALESYLRQLFRLGAFRGATAAEAFFVHCNETNNPPYVTDAGRLIAEVGVAPAEPLEFIVLQLARGGDGTLTLQEK